MKDTAREVIIHDVNRDLYPYLANTTSTISSWFRLEYFRPFTGEWLLYDYKDCPPIYKRKDRNGKVVGWRAVVHIKSYPQACKEFERKQETDDRKLAVTRQIKSGQFQFE